MRNVILDGKTYRMRDVLNLCKEQHAEDRRSRQLALFELKDDSRPKSQRTIKSRFEQRLLFD